MNRSFGTLRVIGPDAARNDDARSRRKAKKEARKQIDQRPYAAHRRQRFGAEIISDNQRIRRIVKLLKQIADKKRDGKKKNLLPIIPYCH